MLIIDEVCKQMQMSESDLIRLSLNAPKMYKVYSIPKRTVGVRIIAQPTPEIKKIQRVIASILEGYLPVHHNAYAYKKRISIKDNALRHVKNSYLLKMDFQNFFNKVKPHLFFLCLDKFGLKLHAKDRIILDGFLFWKPGQKHSKTKVLSVGAPSSPFITNVIMYFFDEKITSWCLEQKIVYTRYADDITFSTNIKDVLKGVPRVVNKTLRSEVPGLSINDSKTVFSSRAHNRHVTGITLATNGVLSIGRAKKREISALVHRFSLNELDKQGEDYLCGLLAYAFNIEPSLLDKLNKKYGDEIMQKLRGIR